MNQAAIFRKGEAAAWLKRNEGRLKPDNDPIIDMIQANKLKFERVLEIGCSNGWRLQWLRDNGFAQFVTGVDPLADAPSFVGTHLFQIWGVDAANLTPFSISNFDCVIYGWCLYLCDPEDYFRIAYEGDRVLKDGGFLIIHDFNSMVPHKRPYKHKEGVYSHKMNFAKLWLCHPGYHVYRAQQSGEGDNECMTWILRKNMAGAFQIRK